jgi:hypothetical protein
MGNVSRLDVHLKSKHEASKREASKREASEREALAAAYLRAAHAYMLISMPTGTSTIFGVFQAILALLVKPDELRPHQGKLVGIEKFASGIFFIRPRGFPCCIAKGIHLIVRRRCQTKDGSTGSDWGALIRTGAPHRDRAASSDKELVRTRRFPKPGPTKVDFKLCRAISSTPASAMS